MTPTEHKYANMLAPGGKVNNASPSVTPLDTLGFAYAIIAVQFGTMDVGLTTLKLQESDSLSAGALASPSDVVGSICGTSANDAGSNSLLPASTNGGTIWLFEVDLRGRKRYLNVAAVVGNGATGVTMSILGILSWGADIPFTASAKNVAQVMRPTGVSAN